MITDLIAMIIAIIMTLKPIIVSVDVQTTIMLIPSLLLLSPVCWFGDWEVRQHP